MEQINRTVHIHVEYAPKTSVSDLVKRLKGRTSRWLQQEYPELGKRYWGRHFWAIRVGYNTHTHQTLRFLHQNSVRLTRPTLHSTCDVLLNYLCRHTRIKGKNLHGTAGEDQPPFEV